MKASGYMDKLRRVSEYAQGLAFYLVPGGSTAMYYHWSKKENMSENALPVSIYFDGLKTVAISVTLFGTGILTLPKF